MAVAAIVTEVVIVIVIVTVKMTEKHQRNGELAKKLDTKADAFILVTGSALVADTATMCETVSDLQNA